VWRRLLLVGLGLVLVLALDQTVRLCLPSEPRVEERPWYLQTVQYHPILGWSGYPNFVGTNDGISIHTNSRGYRDREPVEVTAGDPLRVLFLGDSFTWGADVELADRFSSLLEAPCRSHCDGLPPIHAINKGIIGYGTTQSLLQYLLTKEEDRFDVVILSVFTGNDLSDNAVVSSPSGPRPRLIPCRPARHGEEQPCLEGVPVPAVVDWPEHRLINPRGGIARMFGWSGMVALASQRRTPQLLIESGIGREMQRGSSAMPFRIVTRTSETAIANRIGQLEGILSELDRTIRGDGRAFGVLVFPSARVYAGQAGDELRDHRDILGALDRLHIPFVDYYETTKDAQWEDLFGGLDEHWKPSGHQEAAKLLRLLLVALRAGRPEPHVEDSH
jgi:hypothetical protein